MPLPQPPPSLPVAGGEQPPQPPPPPGRRGGRPCWRAWRLSSLTAARRWPGQQRATTPRRTWATSPALERFPRPWLSLRRPTTPSSPNSSRAPRSTSARRPQSYACRYCASGTWWEARRSRRWISRCARPSSVSGHPLPQPAPRSPLPPQGSPPRVRRTRTHFDPAWRCPAARASSWRCARRRLTARMAPWTPSGLKLQRWPTPSRRRRQGSRPAPRNPRASCLPSSVGW
mmetsp:Transcript_1993/g.4626  ORF Transcript_1993/g.4626 Transcript_1993/m.4626 type:complete len:230 (-) Transcript_1993:699-1388(-)